MNYIVIHVLYKYIMVVEGKIIIIGVCMIIMVGGSITAKGIFRANGRVRSFRTKYKGRFYYYVYTTIYTCILYTHVYYIHMYTIYTCILLCKHVYYIHMYTTIYTCILYTHVYYIHMYTTIYTCILYTHVYYIHMYTTSIFVYCIHMYTIYTCILYTHVYYIHMYTIYTCNLYMSIMCSNI